MLLIIYTDGGEILMANGYGGNKGTSTAKQDILASNGLTFSPDYYELSFLNDTDCTIIINGSVNSIPLAANQGVMIDSNDKKINSIVIVEAGVGYKWFGKY